MDAQSWSQTPLWAPAQKFRATQNLEFQASPAAQGYLKCIIQSQAQANYKGYPRQPKGLIIIAQGLQS